MSAAQLGAHYTDRDKIMLIVEPVVIRPWLVEWAAEKAEIAAELEHAEEAKPLAARTKGRNEAERRYRAFLNRLRGFTVLDPACGSGNFQYPALQALKDLAPWRRADASQQEVDRLQIRGGLRPRWALHSRARYTWTRIRLEVLWVVGSESSFPAVVRRNPVVDGRFSSEGRFAMRIAVAAVAVAALSANAAAAQERGWLAIGLESARHAFSFSGSADAVNMCGTADCEVVETFTACLAVAYSSETASGRPVWTWTEAATEADANRGAQDECEAAGGLACAVMNTYCLDGGSAAAQQVAPAATAELEALFWQSIMNSTNPAEFEAYLAQFPNGVFRALAEARLAALRASPDSSPAAAGLPGGGAGPAASGIGAGGADAPRRPDEVFRDCDECPEMVVMPGGGLALGRYEVTVGEYRAFASATGRGAGGDCWRDPGFPQTDRHPVTCVSWDDAQAYVSWLSRTTGATYRLPTEAEWDRVAAGSEAGCYSRRTGDRGTCVVGRYGSNPAGLSDMVGNVWEWTDCLEGDCGRRVVRGGSWFDVAELLRPGARYWFITDDRHYIIGFRVARTLD